MSPRRRAHAIPVAALILIAGLAASIAIVPMVSRAAAPAQGAHAVQAVGAVGMTVADLDRSVAFYRDVLSFTVEDEEESLGPALEHLEGVFGAHVRSARLRLGEERIHVRYVSTEPQTLPQWNKGAAGIRAFYFADPDDHTLAVIWLPVGKGDPRWQRPTSAPSSGSTSAPTSGLFLGIDHTAIAVADTARSLRFYRDALGLRIAGESENYGTEQEHLNNVSGAHLRITSLRAASGPGVELLEYLAPRDGRPAPADLQANDLSHWQTVLRAADLPAAARGALAAGAVATSAAVVDLKDAVYGIQRARLLRDPDGHGLLLAQ